MQINTLKVVISEDDSQAILDGIITALPQTPKEHQVSSSANFKLILFSRLYILAYYMYELY